MKQTPIIFSSEMVNAILEGRKTQTRRVIKNQPYLGTCGFTWKLDNKSIIHTPYSDEKIFSKIIISGATFQAGNLLWLREKWAHDGDLKIQDVVRMVEAGNAMSGPYYLSDCPEWKYNHTVKTRPSIYMPRRLSRITLEITGVRVERLQEISEQNAEAEGCNKGWYADTAGTDNLWPCPACEGYGVHPALGYNLGVTEVDCKECDTSVKMFRHLWDSINGKNPDKSWDANPWVWVIDFKPHLMNIDEYIKNSCAKEHNQL